MSIRNKNKDIIQVLESTILPRVMKPGRYVGNEINCIKKKATAGKLHFAIAFPEVYEIGMSSQATHILYHLLNRLDYVWAERVFAPWPDMESLLLQQDLPLFTLESFTPLFTMDVIGFSLQYELTYTNLLNMLQLAKLPLFSKDRNKNHPLIIAGGPCTANPEPLSDFIDAFYIGDAEDGLSELCRILYKAKKDQMERQELLQRLAEQPGIYVPSQYDIAYTRSGAVDYIRTHHPVTPKKVITRISSKLEGKNYPSKPLVPLIEITHDRLAVEVMRGCTAGCRFCGAGMIYRPVRERDPDEVISYAREALSNSGYDELSFLSLSISDYSKISDLMQKQRDFLSQKSVNVSFPSMRLDSFQEEIAQFASDVRKSGFTFAPEAGSERLRTVINKNISDEDLFRSIDIALRNGWKLLKFYFMVGLPTETDRDIEAIADTIEHIVRKSKSYGYVRFRVSISPFIPKPHTPFQWEALAGENDLHRKIGRIRMRLRRFKQVKIQWRDHEVARLETILGRGDRRLIPIILSAWRKGARFDGWNDYFHYEIWQEAFDEANLPIDALTGELSTEETLAWNHIDKGLTVTFLKEEREKAYNAVPTPNCQFDRCTVCGLQRFSRCPTRRRGNQAKPVNTGSTIVKNEQPVTYRLRYQKSGYARYVSHLDTIRLFDRACRRADLPVAYSKGFNPRPRLSFAPPLALGYTSRAEYVDITFTAEPEPGLNVKLNRFLPEGLKIIEIKPIKQNLPSLSASITAAEFVIDLGDTAIETSTIRTFLDQTEIEIQREVKGIHRRINVRPFIDFIKKRKNRLFIRTKLIEGKTCRIGEILSRLIPENGKHIKSFPVHRKAQYIDKYSPMQPKVFS